MNPQLRRLLIVIGSALIGYFGGEHSDILGQLWTTVLNNVPA